MKKNMKKALMGLTATAALASLAACAQKDAGTNDGAATPAETETVTIGMSFPAADHGWLGAVIKYAEEEGKAQGVDVEMTTAPNTAAQANSVDDLITKKPDAIVMLPSETDALTPAAKAIAEADIPLVVFDREVNDGAYTKLVKGDNVGIGTNAAEFIGEKLGGKGNIVVISAPPSSVKDQRQQGFDAVLKEKFPDLKIIADQNGAFTREEGYKVMQNLLTAHKQIDAVYTHDDEMALGALQAIEEAGRKDIKVVTGAGGAKEFYGEIKDATDMELATFTYSPLMVKEAVKEAVAIAKGEEVTEKDTTLEATEVTKENIDEFYNENAAY